MAGSDKRQMEIIRSLVGSELGRDEPLSDELFEFALDRVSTGYSAGSGDAGNPEVAKEIASTIRPLLPYEDIFRSSSRDPAWYVEERVTEAPGLSEYERSRAVTHAEYRAFRAATNTNLHFFREYDFQGLSENDVSELVRDPRKWRVTNRESERRDEDRPFRDLGGFRSEMSRRYGDYWSEKEMEDFYFADRLAPRPVVRSVGIDGEGISTVRSGSSGGSIVLEIAPWVPAETVAEHYRYHQRNVYGRTPRPLSLDNLAVASVVYGQLRGAWYRQMLEMREKHDDGHTDGHTDGASHWYRIILSERYPLLEGVSLDRGPTWRILFDLWHRAVESGRSFGSEKTYAGGAAGVQAFRQDFYRTARVVAYPYGRISGGEA